jgi:hypothetical protein
MTFKRCRFAPMLDELEEYLRGDTPLSREYQRESIPAPHALDRRILKPAGPHTRKSQCLAPLAFAASVFLSVALVLAMIFGPQAAKKLDAAPHVVRVQYSSERRAPALWLADISALRRTGRKLEADAEMRRFRSVYPNYVMPRDE